MTAPENITCVSQGKPNDYKWMRLSTQPERTMKSGENETPGICRGAPPIPPVDDETLGKINIKCFHITEGMEDLAVCWVEEWQAVIANDKQDKKELAKILPAGTRILLPDEKP